MFNQFVGLAFGAMFFGSLLTVIYAWQRRNQERSWTRPLMLAGVLIALGLPAVFFVRHVQETTEVDVQLRPDNLHAIRGGRGLSPRYLAKVGQVKAGELLVEFQSPELESTVRVLELQVERLKLQQQGMTSEPVKADASLIQTFANLSHQAELLNSSIQQLTDQDRSLQSRIAAETTHVHLATVDEQYQAELVAKFEELYAQDHATWAELRRRQFTLTKTQERRSQAQKEIDLLKRQQSEIVDDLRATRERAATVSAERNIASEKVEDDLLRATAARHDTIQQMAIQIKEKVAEILAIKQQLIRMAPFDGQVLYRSHSPNSSIDGSPLLVLAPSASDGANLTATVPAILADSLLATKSVVIRHALATGTVEFDAHFLAPPGTESPTLDSNREAFKTISLATSLPPALIPDLVFHNRLPVKVALPPLQFWVTQPQALFSLFGGVFVLCILLSLLQPTFWPGSTKGRFATSSGHNSAIDATARRQPTFSGTPTPQLMN